MAEWLDTLRELAGAVRVADVLDVAFISVLLYAVLTWFRETTSRTVYVGLAILAAVYLLARAFDMFLTAMLFQAVFAVLLLALIVVFQEDLRRVFERIAALGTLRERRQPSTAFSHIDTLVEVASELASKKIGGLIVLRGREPLDRHVDGGIDVDGRISKPLLDSIFDPHSMGHDGATIIENNRITQFAVHLPLSKNLKEVGKYGTRHAAAVGLSEVSDALAIVISEERGQISLAQGGHLKPIGSPAELRDRLEQFCRTKFPAKTRGLWKRLWKEHAALKAVSVVLACVAWYLLAYQAGTVQQTFVVPVELRNVPENLEFDNPPTDIRVTLSGRERAFALLAPSTLKVSLDVAGITEGIHRIPMEDEQVKRPGNLSVYGIEPRSLLLEAHVLVTAELPIEVGTSGRLPEGFVMNGIQVAPRSVPVLLWREELDQTRRLSTEPIDLTGLTQTTTVSASLVIPQHVRFAAGKPPNVRVTVEVARAEETANDSNDD